MRLWDALRPAWIDEARYIVQRDIIREMFASCDILRGRSLNAGCGEGLYAELLESVPGFNDIIHVDIHRPTIGKYRSDRRHYDLCGSLTALPLADSTIDFCLCSEVIEHIQDDSRAMSELRRVLKPGAWLLITVPTPPAPYDPAHVRQGYTLAELHRLLSENGFELSKYRYCLGVMMRHLYYMWQRQFTLLGRRKRNLFPRFLLLLMAYADKHLRFGKPWDLVVLACKGRSVSSETALARQATV